MLQAPSTIETRDSWVVASVALFVMMMAFGSAWIIAVGLKDVAAEFGGTRSVPALASSLAWLGSGTGGLIMSRLGHLPKRGENIQVDHFRFKVTRADHRRIHLLQMSLRADAQIPHGRG